MRPRSWLLTPSYFHASSVISICGKTTQHAIGTTGTMLSRTNSWCFADQWWDSAQASRQEA